MKEQDMIFIYTNIVKDMAEGVITIGLDGVILSINPAGLQILDVDDSVVGTRFAMTFFEFKENDTFNQSILDAVYDRGMSKNVVPYFTGAKTKTLFVTTSYLIDNGKRQAVIAVINDVSELHELKDAIQAMEKIRALNVQLELRNKLISETFGRYLSDEIVATLLNSPEGAQLGGTKREITVLMSDLRGFTAHSAIMHPTDLMTMLNNYLREMTDVIEQYKGTIIEFIGDGILAIFGAPVIVENHARNAVSTAIEMQNRMPAVNRFNQEHGFPTLEMGVALHTGNAILGNIGSEKRTKYGVVGQTINLAGRMESTSVGGQVLISETTKDQCGDVVFNGQGELWGKGASAPLQIFNVQGVGNLSLPQEEQVFHKCELPLEIDMVFFDGKLASSETLHCRILEISQKQARLDTKGETGTNVKFQVHGKDVFAKFVSPDTIHVTMGSLPKS